MNADEFDFENRMVSTEYQRGDENEEYPRILLLFR